MKEKTVLLTGGAGFIGSHTAVELLKAGYSVVIADNFSNSSPDVVSRVGKIAGREPACYAIDIADREKLREAFDREKIGSVIHFAGFKAVGESVARPLRYYRNNIDATLTLLEVMEEFGVKEIVFSSSATVYGVPERVPVTEQAPAGACSNP